MPDFMEYLFAYSWPGNVRELSHAVESAFAQALYSPVLFTQHLPLHIRTAHARSQVKGHEASRSQTGTSPSLLSWREAKDSFEREYTRQLLLQSNGNIMEAGRVSGLSRTRLYQLIKKQENDD